MQQNGQQQEGLFPVDYTVEHNDRQSDMQQHRKQPLHDVHRHHRVIKRGGGLNGRERGGGTFLRDFQLIQCFFDAPCGKQDRNDEIQNHGWCACI